MTLHDRIRNALHLHMLGMQYTGVQIDTQRVLIFTKDSASNAIQSVELRCSGHTEAIWPMNLAEYLTVEDAVQTIADFVLRQPVSKLPQPPMVFVV